MQSRLLLQLIETRLVNAAPSFSPATGTSPHLAVSASPLFNDFLESGTLFISASSVVLVAAFTVDTEAKI